MPQTTVADILEWLDFGHKKNATHMLVVCDTFDYEDYPRYVLEGQNVQEVFDAIHNKNMQKVMEVYSYAKDIEEQLNAPRAWNL